MDAFEASDRDAATRAMAQESPLALDASFLPAGGAAPDAAMVNMAMLTAGLHALAWHGPDAGRQVNL